MSHLKIIKQNALKENLHFCSKIFWPEVRDCRMGLMYWIIMQFCGSFLCVMATGAALFPYSLQLKAMYLLLFIWLLYFIFRCFEVKWSDVKWVTLKFLGAKVSWALGWPYTEGTWLHCNYFIWCVCYAVVVLTCFVMCGCVYVWVW